MKNSISQYRNTSLQIAACCSLLLSIPVSYAVTETSKMEMVTVTGSRDKQNSGRLAASISVVDSDDLQQVLHTHINESLSRVAGVWIGRGNGQESLPAIRSPSLTGAGSCGAFYIAEDGVPVRPVGFCNVNQLFDTNNEQAGRIEVIKGPGNTLHGSGALHGVINVISPTPSKTPESQFSLEGGPHNYNRVKISHSDSYDKSAYLINFNSTNDGGYKDDSGFDQQKMSIRHDYESDDLSASSLLHLSNLNQETAGYVQGFEAYKDADRKKENPNPEAYRDSQSIRFQTRIEKQLGDNSSLIVTPYIRHSDMEFLMHFLPGTPVEENGQSSVGIQTSYIRSVSKKLSLTNGFDAEYTDAYLKQSQQGGFSSFPSGQQYDYKVNAKVLAAFVDASYDLATETKISAGARFEHIKYVYDNKMISGNTSEDGSVCVNGFTGAVGCRYSRPQDRDDSFGNWSFTADAVHQLNTETTVVARLSHGFRAPQATELYRLQAGQFTANLDPEEIDSIELGVRGSMTGVSYQLTAFFMDKSNVIFQDSDRLNTDSGETEHYGLEYRFFKSFNDTVDITLSGTLARHKYTSNVTTPVSGGTAIIPTKGNDIDSAPRHMGSVQVGWNIGEETRAELEWVSLGKYYTDIDNLHSYDGHDLFNLRIRHQIARNISGGLRLTNLADTDYAERADYTSFNGDRYFIGEPRSLYADIQINF